VSFFIFILYKLNRCQHFRTCFWGGDVFTPKLLVKDKNGQDVPVQQYLQNAFLDMWDMVVHAVGDLEGVIGFQVRLNYNIISIQVSYKVER
jgi:hypothetical protein